MTESPSPKFKRRKAERPAEIVAAALEVFAEKGFAAARLDEIARRAGVSKGALYLYFETKEDLFRAVVHDVVAPKVRPVAEGAAAMDAPFETVIRAAMGGIAALLNGDRRVGAVAKVVIGESRNFPELARIWKENVLLPGITMLTALVARAQARGEVKAGDPRLYAFGFMGPVLLSLIWRETFVPVGAEPIDVERLVEQHLEAVLGGMLT